MHNSRRWLVRPAILLRLPAMTFFEFARICSRSEWDSSSYEQLICFVTIGNCNSFQVPWITPPTSSSSEVLGNSLLKGSQVEHLSWAKYGDLVGPCSCGFHVANTSRVGTFKIFQSVLNWKLLMFSPCAFSCHIFATYVIILEPSRLGNPYQFITQSGRHVGSILPPLCWLFPMFDDCFLGGTED